MSKSKLWAAVLCGALLGATACATPESPSQAVFQAKTAYAATLQGAVAYKRLPPCSTAKPPCSDAAIVAQLQKADNVAAGALDAAEQAVRTPGFGQGVIQTAVATAQSALAAFTAIVGGIR